MFIPELLCRISQYCIGVPIIVSTLCLHTDTLSPFETWSRGLCWLSGLIALLIWTQSLGFRRYWRCDKTFTSVNIWASRQGSGRAGISMICHLLLNIYHKTAATGPYIAQSQSWLVCEAAAYVIIDSPASVRAPFIRASNKLSVFFRVGSFCLSLERFYSSSPEPQMLLVFIGVPWLTLNRSESSIKMWRSNRFSFFSSQNHKPSLRR